MSRGTRLGAVAIALVLASAGGATLATWLTFRPSGRDLLPLGAFIAATGLGGAALALLASRVLRRLPLAAALWLWTAVVLAIALADVLGASLLMFISGHDLRLLLILLASTLGVTAGPVLLMGAEASRRVRLVEEGTSRVGAGDLTAHIDLEGRDELARVAAAVNLMSRQLGQAEAERARIAEARRELFAAVSHDLRTPLATMRAMVEAMTDEVVADDATRTRYLARVAGEIQRLSLLVDDLFEVARLDSGELRLHLDEVQIDSLIEEAVDAFRLAAQQAGVELSFVGGGAHGTVRADPSRLTRALYNLVQNAVRHTPPDGTVTVRTSGVEGGVKVEVRDTGEGVDPSDLPHVFDRFYRGEPSRSRGTAGAGLGLAIVRSIVEAHGGSVSAEGNLHEGAVFTFVLPRDGRAI